MTDSSFSLIKTIFCKAARGSFLLALIHFQSQAAFACTVCFGNTSSDLTRGFFWGIVLLLALPFTMLAFFVTYIALNERKKRQNPL